MRLILPIGTTETGLIDGISAAGASPEVMEYTPPGDAEIVVYGEPTSSPVTPVSPTGCPTPATITRAVREVVGFDLTVVDAGLAKPTDAPTVDLDARPGNDVRAEEAVPDAVMLYERAREFGSTLPDDEIMIGETIPGGTTTALGVLTALGESIDVSSSLPSNPLDRKQTVVEEGLTSSELAPGDCADEPLRAIRHVGDPVQATALGIATGAVETGTAVTFAGGTQLVTVAALLRHAGIDDELTIATTSFVADDQGSALERTCSRLDCRLVVTDPGFDRSDHVAMERYCAGEGKEGVAMGGALSLVPDGMMGAVRDQIAIVYDRLGLEDERASSPGDGMDDEGVGDETVVDECRSDAERPADRTEPAPPAED